MFIEVETMVRYEQYRDAQRQAQQERLIRHACAHQQAARSGRGASASSDGFSQMAAACDSIQMI